SILYRIEKLQKNPDFKYISRFPEKVTDSLKIKGYLPHSGIIEKMKLLDRAIWNGVDLTTIPLPESLKNKAARKLEPIPAGDEKAILERTGIVLPDSLKEILVIPDSMMRTARDFNRIRNHELQRSKLLEEARLAYNKKAQNLNPDSAITAYRKYAVKVYSDSLQIQLRDSLKQQNAQLLKNFNDSIVRMVNDSINRHVLTLQRHVLNDSISINIQSLTGNPSRIWLSNNQRSINRMYIKNIQNDSLGIQLMNIDKHTLGIAIEDNVTFNRIAEKQRRDFVFEKIEPQQELTKINKKFEVITPWDIGGNGTFGITQTYLNNWKAGGKSAFSFLMVLKGYANYSKDSKLKWENSGELRNGWIRQGGGVDQTQKNDDKLELISRLGISAFKKWYYSAEIDFVTQFFNGYNYPDKTNPISSYMSPAKTLFKLGLDYKPNSNFSLFISPITAKTVFVRDTALIDQTKFGVSASKRSFWEPGFNADLRYKIDLNPQISVETKYKMFMNYQQPFKKVDISWENTLVARLTDRINMTMMLYFLYDDNVTFPTGKTGTDGKEIYKPKWQTKELMTVGFSYKINRHIYSRKKVN
ncbi:MAG: DUF3078 domain-containing protein, partial [Prolixibacteraceae bacterium]